MRILLKQFGPLRRILLFFWNDFMDKEYKFLAISDFTINNFVNCLNNDPSGPPIKCLIPPYSQFVQLLVDPKAEYWGSDLNRSEEHTSELQSR